MPAAALNVRCRWNGLRFNWRLSPSSVTASSRCCSRYRQIFSTSSEWASRVRSRSGVQRRQGRKPARSAASRRWKKITFSRRGRREGHNGRQYTPVVITAKKKTPSMWVSRVSSASQKFAFRSEEDHVFAPRPAGGAQRAAVHAGGDHGEEENTVHVGVAGFERLPEIRFQIGRRSRFRAAAGGRGTTGGSTRRW